MQIRFLILLCFISPLILSAQWFSEKSYPADFFRYPLNIPLKLNANFGELRPNHFHMGLDLFTERRENLPVFAVADGWISRLRIDPNGFGNATYISHPNGYTTLYAHMNSFPPGTQKELKIGQYEKQSWKGDVYFEEGQFLVKKGDFIGYSGNTGASAGPHVHYEIRRTSDEACVNPLFFHYVKDITPPRLKQVAVYDRNQSTYEQLPRIITPIKAGDAYTLSGGVLTVTSNRISLAVSAIDLITGFPNQYGIYEALVYLDDQPVSGFQLDGIDYLQTRYMNAHVDYRLQASGYPEFQHLTPLPGDRLPVYTKKEDGVLKLDENVSHRLKIILRDAAGNASVFQCILRCNGSAAPTIPLEQDSRYMLPNQINIFETEEVQMVSSEKSFYDAFRFIYSGKPAISSLSNIHIMHRQTIPIQDSVRFRIKSLKTLSDEQAKRVVMMRTGKGKKEVRRTTVENDWYEARYRDFGEFWLVLDEQAPLLKVAGITDGMTVSDGHSITCTVSDNLEKIRSFRAEIDGSWILFTGNGPVYRYQVDEYCPKGRHVLKISTEDEAGNQTTKEISFYRN